MMFVRQKQQGFTLIEVMIVVAIIAIISAIAYPSYVRQVQKSKRSDAHAGLQLLAQHQEAYFSRNYSYAANLQQLGFGTESDGTTPVGTVDSPENMYAQSVSAVIPAACDGTRTASCSGFTVQAVPKAGTSQVHDKQCAAFTFNNLGRKSAANNASTPAVTTEECW